MIRRSGTITLPKPPGSPRLARTKENIQKRLGLSTGWRQASLASVYHLSQKWCRDNFPTFIEKDIWPPNSSDLNPLDYSIWDQLVNNINWNKVY
ncbi:unnamed protein product [Rotaria socialis]|uniref:Uncharacterized protein n=1 Tax=Rotaria socialis TaxID=392032 RepID=A0A818Z9Q9_9BILA|nr:unnamed protein product [Rotaria socialis]